MTLFLLRRLAGAALVVFAVASLCFLLSHVLPGSPFDEGKDLDPVIRANLLRRHGLDAPLGTQYLTYLRGLLTGDLGPSLRLADYRVNDVLAESLPISAALGCLALLLALLLGLLAGALAALRRGGWIDTLVTGAASVGLAVPSFVLGGLLVLLFAFRWPLFPVAGLGGLDHLVLPTLTLGLPYAAAIARLFRTGLLDVLGQDWVVTARAKGLSPTAVLVAHAARAALLPVVSYLVPATAGILTGSLVVEQIFALPGLGSHFVDAALNADYFLASGVAIVYAVLVSLAGVVVDLLLVLLDPRIEAS